MMTHCATVCACDKPSGGCGSLCHRCGTMNPQLCLTRVTCELECVDARVDGHIRSQLPDDALVNGAKGLQLQEVCEVVHDALAACADLGTCRERVAHQHHKKEKLKITKITKIIKVIKIIKILKNTKKTFDVECESDGPAIHSMCM